MSSYAILLYVYTLTCGTLMLLVHNPVNSVILYMLTVLGAVFALVSVGLDFIAYLILIVYIGALAPLFLFTVMLISIRRASYDRSTYYILCSGIFILCTYLYVYYVFSWDTIHLSETIISSNSRWTWYFSTARLEDTSRIQSVRALGLILIYSHPIMLLFVVISLLISIIGSISLTHYTYGYSIRRQRRHLSRSSSICRLYMY